MVCGAQAQDEAVLVKPDEAPSPIVIQPARGGEGVMVGFSIGEIKRNGFWKVVKAHPVKSIGAAVAAGAATYYAYDALAGSSGSKSPTPSPANVSASSGRRSASVEGSSGNVSILIEDHESGSGDISVIVTHPTQ